MRQTRAPCAEDTKISVSSILQSPQAGVLLHPDSLPSGVLNEDVWRWLDFMQAANLHVWQMLPLTIPDETGSPYQSCSAFALNPALLGEDSSPVNRQERTNYRQREGYWLDDFALFQALTERFEQLPWWDWPDQFRQRDPAALTQARRELADEVDRIIEQQYRLDQRWKTIRTQAGLRNIRLFGDLPIFVALNSADVWANPTQFLLDENLQPVYVAGVPPDYFSATGQRWGNPHYNWPHMQADGFSWWKARVRREFDHFDLLRIDHFRGLSAVWMIRANAKTAVDGFWQDTPGDELLQALKQEYPQLPIVAEDLGSITDEVLELKRKYQLPGMSVLQFAFDAFDDNPHKPQNIGLQDVVYTGTHDNDTCVGWFNRLEHHQQDFVFQVLGIEPNDDIACCMIEAALQSNASLAVIPLQDMLRLGSEARMNTPGMIENNWKWRFEWPQITEELVHEMHERVAAAGRDHVN